MTTTPAPSLNASITSAGSTHMGSRALNEDAVVIEPGQGLYGVVDGSGGPGRGDLAAAIVADAMRSEPSLAQALALANERILAAAAGSKGIGATFAFVQIAGDRAAVAHAGETRIYLARNGRLTQLSQDHTLAAQLVKLKQLQPDELAGHPARRTVLRFLGKEATPKYDEHALDLSPGDVLLLATDGCYLGCTDEDLLAIAAGAPSANELGRRVAALLDRAARSGIDDNASLIALRVPAPADAGIPSAFERGVQRVLERVLQSQSTEAERQALLAPLLHEAIEASNACQALLMGDRDGLLVDLAEVTARPMLPLRGQIDWSEALPRGGSLPTKLSNHVLAVPLIEESGVGEARIVLYLQLNADRSLDEAAIAPLRGVAPWLAVLVRVMMLKDEGQRLSRRFNLLNDLGRAVASSLNLDDVLGVLLEQTLQLTKGSLAYVIMPTPAGLSCRYGLDSAGRRVDGLAISHTLANRVLESREALCILDMGADEASQTASVLAMNLQSVMCVPLVVKDELIGLLYVSSESITRTFTAQDLDLLIAIANQTALSVQNALYVSEMDEKKRMEAELQRIGKEMEIATRIQAMLVPTELAAPGFDLDMAQVTATEVGGDLIDYLPQPDGRFWLAVGDVTGHGLTPGLIMMMAQSMITGLVTMKPDAKPSELLVALNWALYNNVRDRLRNDHYMTLQLLHHLGDGQFVASGMHCEILIYRAATATIDTIEIPGIWTGFLPDVWELTTDHRFQLAAGDVMLLFTDGLIEAMDRMGQQFDLARLASLLTRDAALPAAAIKERILGEVRGFLHEQKDDISLIVLRRLAALPKGPAPASDDASLYLQGF